MTVDGVMHPATRLAVTPDENRQKWAALPALASVAQVGGSRPGAQVLAVALTAGGTPQPLIATQRYGQGRSMVFAGEASWRWRMMRPATDTSYETIWRQLARWVTAGAQGPVTIGAISPPVPGITDRISVFVRDEDFRPVANAEVAIEIDGAERREAAADRGAVEPAGRPLCGVDAVRSTRRLQDRRGGDARAARAVGTASRPVLVGGVDLEMTQPRLNEAVLRRLAGRDQRPLPARRSGVGHLPVAAARVARRGRHARDARPLAQWMEPAGDRRPAGVGVGAHGAGWAWREQRS